MEHGTRKQYRKGCKCAACKAAEASYKRERIAHLAASSDIPHGTVVGYVRKCRCEACTEAKRSYEANRVPDFGSPKFPHGTSIGSKYGCTCDGCKNAEKERKLLWQAAQDYSAVDFPHGTVAGYNRNCKCSSCKEAWRNNSDARREALDRNAAGYPHGTVKGYKDGCRCEICVDAITVQTSARHKERMATDIAYAKSYKGRCRVKSAKRRAATKSACGNNTLVRLIYTNTPEGYEVDHIIPLSKGGHHVSDNLQYLPKRENRRKHANLNYDCAAVAIRWQDLIDQGSTTISKESRFQAEPKCLATVSQQLKI